MRDVSAFGPPFERASTTSLGRQALGYLRAWGEPVVLKD